MTEDDWDLVMGVHLKGAFLMTKAAQKHFVEQKYGKILNLSSVSALGNRGQANYSAAKMGVQGFTRTLGIELGPFGVNANAIAPGFIATEMTDATAARLKMDVEEFRRLNAEANPVAPGRLSPRTSPPPLRSCAATRRRTSPARPCTSTAAPSSADRSTPGAPPRLGGPRVVHTGNPNCSRPDASEFCHASCSACSAAVLVAASLVLAGCGGDDEAERRSPTAQAVDGRARRSRRPGR